MKHFARIELQGFYCRGKAPVNSSILLENLSGTPWVSRGIGLDQVCISTNLSLFAEEILAELLDHELSINNTQLGKIIEWSQTRPSCGTKSGGGCLNTSLLSAMQEAFTNPCEGGKKYGQGYILGDFCSTQLHFGFRDVLSEKGILFYNLLTLVSPNVLEWLYPRYSVIKVARNIVLSKFARPERLPAPRWFECLSDYQAYFESVPCLVKEVPPGRYEKDLSSPQGLRDWVSEKLVWTPAQIHPSSDTVGLYCLPSLQPKQAVEILEIVDAWLSKAIKAVGNKRFANMVEAVSSGLIPPFESLAMSQTEEEWLRRWMEY